VAFPTLLLGLALVEKPAVKVLGVHWRAVFGLELICLVACSCRVLHLRLCLRRGDFWSDIKNCVIIASIAIMFIDVVVWLAYKEVAGREVIRVSRVLRPILIFNFSDNRNLRKLLRNIKKTVVDVISVLVLIFLFIAIFAMMATKFFERRTLIDPHGDPYLDNFLDSYWNLYVLMTTANSPDVSLPAFRSEQAFFFFFMPFSVITTFILMNILLAVVYKHYKMHLLEEVKVDVGIIQGNLIKAFGLLKDPQTNHIEKDVWLKASKEFGCPDALPILYWDYMVPNQDLPGISLQAFFKITDLLSSKIMIVMTKKTWLELRVPFIYNSSLSCYLRWVVDHIAFTLFYDALIFANAVVLSIKNSPTYLEDIFLVLFNIEIKLKLYTYGPRKFVGSAWNCYDCLVIYSATIFRLVVDVENFQDTKDEEMSAVFLDMVLTLRVLRLLKLLLSIPQLRLIVSTVMQIVPSMGSYALLLFLFYYMYAIVGMELFAGKVVNDTINCGEDALNGTDFVTEKYCILSFNNILYSFVVLWTLTLVNQWHIIAGGFVAVTTKASRIYFLSFHVLIVLIILNIFLAFVIEAFMLQIDLDRKKQEGIDEHLDERGMNARRESHPQNQPVWYRSSTLTSTNDAEEEENLRKVYIGTKPLEEKIRYKRQKSTKSYNQLLLEMFQEDIQAEETSLTDAEPSGVTETQSKVPEQGETSTWVSKQSSSTNRKLSSVREDDPELIETDKAETQDSLSLGSLENLDII
jgi:two pore calcium channel protein 3